MKTSRNRLLTILLGISFAGSAAATDFSVTVEPNYPPAQARQVYAPLLAYLSKATGQHFVLKAAANYHAYWSDLRNNVDTDFAFEEAHFTDYRINRQRFTPLVRTIDPTKFVLLVDSSNASGGANGLIGRRVASMSAPSLGYLLLGELYKNPIAQPEIQSAAASWKDGVEMVFARESDGAMVPGYIAATYPNLVSVATSRDFTGRAFSASPKVPPDVRKKVTDALLALHKNPALFDVISELGTTQFVPASPAEYAGNERLLRGVFGYVPLKSAPPPAANSAPDAPPGAPVKATGISVKAKRG